MASAQLRHMRFPMALVGALLITMVLFAFLHMLISRRGDIGEVTSVVKIEFTRLRTESEIETRKQEKVEQAPPPPQISLQKTNMDVGGGSDIGAIQTLVQQQTQSMGNINSGGG